MRVSIENSNFKADVDLISYDLIDGLDFRVVSLESEEDEEISEEEIKELLASHFKISDLMGHFICQSHV